MKIVNKIPTTVYYLIFIITFLLVAQLLFANKNGTKDALGLHFEGSSFIPGVITVKVKEGIGPFLPQKSNVSFGINSLDKLVSEFSISTLNNRFKHKPIQKNSGLPALDRIYKVEFPEDINVWEVVKAFAKDPNVEYAEPVAVGRFLDVPDDPLYSMQSHLPQIMASEAWDIHKGEDGSQDIVIGITDSGTDWSHPDLIDNLWQNMGEDADGDGRTVEFSNGNWVLDPGDLNGIDDDGNGYVDDVCGWDFYEFALSGNGSNPDPYPHTVDHGTHVTGIAAGVTNNGEGISSISYNLKYMPLCIGGPQGLFGIWKGMDGIIYCAENGADIINCSWMNGYQYMQADAEAIEYATGLGSIVVAAAGNDNTDNIIYPAGYPGVISVCWIDGNDNKAYWANYGIYVDIASPGTNILSTIMNGEYESYSGASMSTPVVSGLFGLLKSYHPEWGNEQLISQVLGSADDIDASNPDYVNMLGDGRINAFHALNDENVISQQELRLALEDYSMNDDNGNGIIEQGEAVSIDLQLRNYAHFVSSDNVTFTLTTPDPDITITSGSITTSVPGDDKFEITEAFEFSVSGNSITHEAIFYVHITADIAITYGQQMILSALIEPSGCFVWDRGMYMPGYSGSFIAEYMQEQGLEVIHSGSFPHSFEGFDAVFLSFGNESINGQWVDPPIYHYSQSLVIQEYLENGGKLYIDGMAILGGPEFYEWENKDELWELFGVSDATYGNTNVINSLEGQNGTLAEGMSFVQSNQPYFFYIDEVTPLPGAFVPFVESGYGNVSVYNTGTYGQRTFYMGYCLADLVDVDPHSSRYHLLSRILEFFDMAGGENSVVANFKTDKSDALPGEEIQFTDWSVSEEGYEVESWGWDFDEDGIIDSYDQNPVWAYTDGGNYDVMLVASNGQSIDTLLRKDVVIVRSGMFVFEGEENGIDQSGTFIMDYLVMSGYDVVYSNHFPSSLDGFDAVFASFGSKYLSSPALSDEIANTIESYGLQGGRLYLEGSQALGFDQGGNNFLWYIFGIEDVVNGSMNAIDQLQGQEGSIMGDMQFNASSQFDVYSIDKYVPFEAATTAQVAFEESDYGEVAVQFDGTDIFGQKTFIMSYSLASLEDGDHPNTRHEMLDRVMEFFDLATGISDPVSHSIIDVLVYPNPASDHVTIAIEQKMESIQAVELYNISGQMVMSIPANEVANGNYTIRLNTQSLSAGTYFYRILSTDEIYGGKFLIMK